MTFQEFNLHPDLLEGIEALHFTHATPIQELAIPRILEGKDIIGCAQTGTGKTAAFILPILHKIITSGETDYTQALVIVPTRELSMQIDQVVEAYSYFTGVSSIAVYGGGDGKSFDREKTAIQSGVDIIIATPGRLIAHMQLGYVKFNRLRFLILDEADRMLDMGFLPDLMKILAAVNPNRQTLLFSATMPEGVRKLAKSMMRQPEMINIAISKPAEGISQKVCYAEDDEKMGILTDILKDRVGQRILIFASSRVAVSKLHRRLAEKKFKVLPVSSDFEQSERERAMLDFRNRKVDILVATDVLSRGIDVEGIDMVINFDVPHDAEDYVHRVGRTARAERKGEALTFVSMKDRRKMGRIERLIGNQIEKLDSSLHPLQPSPAIAARPMKVAPATEQLKPSKSMHSPARHTAESPSQRQNIHAVEAEKNSTRLAKRSKFRRRKKNLSNKNNNLPTPPVGN